MSFKFKVLKSHLDPELVIFKEQNIYNKLLQTKFNNRRGTIVYNEFKYWLTFNLSTLYLLDSEETLNALIQEEIERLKIKYPSAFYHRRLGWYEQQQIAEALTVKKQQELDDSRTLLIPGMLIKSFQGIIKCQQEKLLPKYSWAGYNNYINTNVLAEKITGTHKRRIIEVLGKHPIYVLKDEVIHESPLSLEDKQEQAIREEELKKRMREEKRVLLIPGLIIKTFYGIRQSVQDFEAPTLSVFRKYLIEHVVLEVLEGKEKSRMRRIVETKGEFPIYIGKESVVTTL